MKRTPILLEAENLPRDLHSLISGAQIYDSSCSPEARVYFIDKDGGYYLKKAERGSLATEALMAEYFHKKGLGASVLSYTSGDYDFLLTERVSGEDCTYADYLAEPKRLCDLLGERLRMLHETDCEDCPVSDRMSGYFSTVERNASCGIFDPSFLPEKMKNITAERALAEIEKSKSRLNSRVLLHGDYCLPNIMLDEWKFSGFIDLGNGGVGDRHVDLFWGAWTLGFNLGTDEYRSRFFDAYGRDKVDEQAIATVALAECFG